MLGNHLQMDIAQERARSLRRIYASLKALSSCSVVRNLAVRATWNQSLAMQCCARDATCTAQALRQAGLSGSVAAQLAATQLALHTAFERMANVKEFR